MTKKAILFFLFLLVSPPITEAEHDLPNYPPYPDVWEREFFGCLDEGAYFVTTNTGEVIINQTSTADKNGEPTRNEKGQVIDSKGVLAFFSGEFVLDPRARFDLENNKDHKQIIDYFHDTHSCKRGIIGFQSTDLSTKAGGKINWIKGLAVDRYQEYGTGADKKEEIAGVQIDSKKHYSGGRISYAQHAMYYNKPNVLVKRDENGKVLWRKVFLYFHPWWGYYLSEGEDAYTFFYFKKGCITLIDEDRMFVFFGGTKKIFRLDEDGEPKTTDNNMMVIDFLDYQDFLSETLSRIDMEKEKIRQNGHHIFPCLITTRENEKYYVIGDYDFFGKKIAQKNGFDLKTDKLIDIIAERKGMEECIHNYELLTLKNNGGF